MADQSNFKAKFETLVEIFEQSISKFPERPLFGVKSEGSWGWMTYEEFGKQTTELRGGLASLGIETGDRVGVITNNRPEWAIGAYATYTLASCYVPMYESQTAKDWLYILRDCGAKAVIVATDEIRAQLEEIQGELPELKHIIVCGDKAGGNAKTFDAVRAIGRDTPKDIQKPAGTDIAGFVYTSGTTGKPKGVRLTHSNLASNVSAIHAVFPWEPSDRSLSFLPWAHSFGQTVELHGLFSMGASLGIAESVPKIIANLAEVKPTLLFSVPRIFNKIHDGVLKKVDESGGLKKTLFTKALETARDKKTRDAEHRSSGFVDFKHKWLDKLVFEKVRGRFGGRLKYAFSGGAAISKEVAEFIDALGITVYEGYGLTETSPIATSNWPGARKIGSVGQAIPGVRVEIDLKVTEHPKNGEIIIHGHNVMEGYHGLEGENDKVFTEDKGFRTGDMGFLDDDGFLYITGRIKEQYKLENGKYVVPSPLEAKVCLSPMIANAFIDGTNRPFNAALIIPDPDGLKAWATAKGIGGGMEEWIKNDQVHAMLREEVDNVSGEFKSYEKIRKFVVVAEDFSVENGLLTPKMSVKRLKVMERYGADLAALYKS